MAIEYFHISESDHDMLEQIMELEQEVHPARGTGLNYFEAHSFIRYGRVYAAVECWAVPIFCGILTTPANVFSMKWW